MQVEWSNEALTDRAAIIDYLIVRNPHAAKRILLRLIDATMDLTFFPYMGRKGIDNTREWVAVYPYVLLYEVDDTLKVVRILRLWHLSQDRNSM